MKPDGASPATRSLARARLSRRTLFAVLGGLGLASGGYAAGAYRQALTQADIRLEGQSSLFEAASGTLEYAVAGQGPPLMMIHGTGGGFDQGLLFAQAIRNRQFQIISPSRFGYLRSAFPGDPTPARQADALVELMDHLGLERLPVVGGSAGAMIAAEIALRHPDRCSHLILLVPAANLTGRDPVKFSALQQMIVDTVLGSDWWFWSLLQVAPGRMMRTLLATDPALLGTVSAAERKRAELILAQISPISRKQSGLRNDAYWAGAPSQTAFERIATPTLIVSCEDDLFGTAATARQLAERISGALLKVYTTGGHIWLGRDDDIADLVSEFVQGPALSGA